MIALPQMSGRLRRHNFTCHESGGPSRLAACFLPSVPAGPAVCLPACLNMCLSPAVCQVFRCIPTDSVKSFVQLQEYQREVPLALSYPSRAKDMLKDVRVGSRQTATVLSKTRKLTCT